MATLEIEGQIFDPNKRPLSKKKIEYALPPRSGLSAFEASLMKDKDQWDVHETLTDEYGKFTGQIKYVQHSSCWIIPPLGCYPKQVPEPYFGVRVYGQCTKGYSVRFQDRALEFRIHDLEKHEVVKPTKSDEITGQLQPLDFGWKTQLSVNLGEDAYCKISK